MSMFHNPFNSKVVSDITRFLEEHKNDITINPCLDEAAREAAEVVASEPILEDRRMIMRDLFNEAVANCGCKGTTRESSDFAKTVERYVQEGKKSLPPAFLKNIQKKKDAAKKKDGEDKKEEVEEESFDPLTEAAKKRKQEPWELVYKKWFDRVPVDIMDITKIAKGIEAALDSKADLEKVMPELVNKYRKG